MHTAGLRRKLVKIGGSSEPLEPPLVTGLYIYIYMYRKLKSALKVQQQSDKVGVYKVIIYNILTPQTCISWLDHELNHNHVCPENATRFEYIR